MISAAVKPQAPWAFDPAVGPRTVTDWLPTSRSVTIGVLAGASSPEIVVVQVIERLATFLG